MSKNPVTNATNLASDPVNVGFFNPVTGMWENTKSPETEAPLRFELWTRTATVDMPVRDDDGNPVMYPGDLEGYALAAAHLQTLPAYDATEPYPRVHFIKMVTDVNEFGATARCTYEVRTEEVIIKDKVTNLPITDPATGNEVVKIYQNREERQALSALGEAQKVRRNAISKQRNWLQQAHYTVSRGKAEAK